MKRSMLLMAIAAAVCGMMSDALAEDFGVLQLTTEPSEVTVYVDGTKKGTSTPIAFKLNEGDHTIQIKCSKYKTIEFQIFVASGAVIKKNISLIRSLRSGGIMVSDYGALEAFDLRKDKDRGMVPIQFVQNKFKDNGDGTVTDQATGLMWQKSGTDELIKYSEMKDYIKEMNYRRFAGYSDWRLPTVDELCSLLTKERQSNNLYINPIFDKTQTLCWTSDFRDHHPSGGVWIVSFNWGGVDCLNFIIIYHVRAVRSMQ